MPDGREVRIGRERFLAPEILFNPMLGGFEYPSCSEMVFKAINDCDVTLRKEFYRSMLISGGTTMFPGFPTRLRNEVESMYRTRVLKNSSAKGAEITVLDSPTRKYNVFIGAAFIAQKSLGIDQSWIYKKQYEEEGDRLIERMAYNMK